MNAPVDTALKAEPEQKNAQAHEAAQRASDYEWGFVSDIEQEFAPKGLSEETVRFISGKKNEPDWMLEWRLKAYRHWLTMTPPDWAKLDVPPIDYQDAYYYAAPKKKVELDSLDDLDPEIRRTYEKLGIPIEEQKVLAGGGWRAQGRGRCGVRLGVRRHNFPQGGLRKQASSSARSARRSASSLSR